MNNEKRVKLVFKTISEIAGFEIKPYKAFCMIGNIENDIKGEYNAYKISESLNLYYKKPNGYFDLSEYNISAVLNGEYRLEEIKEPLLTEEGKDFLRYFKFDELLISKLLYLNMFSKNDVIVTSVHLNNINFSFSRLKIDRRYSREELGL